MFVEYPNVVVWCNINHKNTKVPDADVIIIGVITFLCHTGISLEKLNAR